MLIIAIPLSLLYSIVLRKYDLRKYRNTLEARSQTSVNKFTPACGMCSIFFLFSFSIKKASMMSNYVIVNDIHFWDNKYDHPEE